MLQFKHTGCIGDLIYFLPVVRYYGGGNLFLDTTELSVKKIDEPIIQYPILNELDSSKVKYVRCGLDKDKFLSLKPLLEIQDYVKSLNLWEGVVFSPIDCHNNVPFLIHVLPRKSKEKNLCHFFMDFHKVPLKEVEKPWINTDYYYDNSDKIIISRSFRYRNPYFPWHYICKKYRKNIFFIGNESEHEDFCKNFGHVKYIKTKNFLEVARNIANCHIFIGNQSACYALAESMKINTIQETSLEVPDCLFERHNAEYFISYNKRNHEIENCKNLFPCKVWL